MKKRPHLPDAKKAEEQGRLTRVCALAPLLEVIIRILELLLKALRIIN